MTRFILAVLMSIAFATPVLAAEEKAIFAGGCFWCMHAEFEGLDGVTKVVSGYTGGTVAHPSYEQVSSGATGHVEAIEVAYDPTRISYAQLLDVFWGNVDPTDAEGQFCDKGSQYHAGIFYMNDAQKTAAEASLQKTEEKLKQKVATFIKPAMPFYAAEDYHQSYYKKNAVRYKIYKSGCGREGRLKELQGEHQ